MNRRLAFASLASVAWLAGCAGDGSPGPATPEPDGTPVENTLLVRTTYDAGHPWIVYREGAKGPAFGAARLARLAVTGEAVEAVCTVPLASEVVEPNPALVDAYRARGEKFRRLYRAVKAEFRS